MALAKISTSLCSVKEHPDPHAEASNELLFGEPALVLEEIGQWCKIRSTHDGYEGFIARTELDFTPSATSHWVSTKATYVFLHADIKAPVVRRLLFGSQVTADAATNKPKFLAVRGGGFVWAEHCTAQNTVLTSPLVTLAQNHYLNAPYLWGGRSTDGCDCSGLVQMLATAVGISLPRDSGDQEAALTSTIDFASRAAEDLVYWPGHVGVLKTPDLLLHATAHSMRCCVEPLDDVIQRAGAPSSIKRIG